MRHRTADTPKGHRNYVIIYDIEEDSVRVLRILHAARQWPSQKG